MLSLFSARATTLAAVVGLLIGSVTPASALDGANAVNLTPYNGWLAFELVTQGNNITSLGDAGYGNTLTRGLFDGLGTHLDGGKLSIDVNHETADAAISRVDVSIAAMRQAVLSKIDAGVTPFPSQIVTGVGYAYDRIYDGTYHAVANPNPVAVGNPAVVTYGNANFDRFCSGSSYLPEAFGPGRGLLDPMYITGEEVTGGKFYAVDQVNRTMWEMPALGLGMWENAAQVDTGDTTHVALVLSSDANAPATDYLRLYVGTKGIDANGDGSVDFLERNGLRGGGVYYFRPDDGFSTTDLPNGTVTGTWSASTTGGLREDKLEDVHTNPENGNQLVFADQTDGVYRLDLALKFVAGEFDPAGSATTISQIDAHPTAPLGSPDNLAWSRNGKIYVQEDGDGYEIWEINQTGGGHVRVAQAFTEPSGVIDTSQELGFLPGSVLLSSIMGSGGNAQLVVLISPTATILVPGDYNQNGAVDAADYTLWHDNLGSATALPNDDTPGVGPDDYDRWKTHFGELAGGSSGAIGSAGMSSTVPEPASLGLALIVAPILLLSRKR